MAVKVEPVSGYGVHDGFPLRCFRRVASVQLRLRTPSLGMAVKVRCRLRCRGGLLRFPLRSPQFAGLVVYVLYICHSASAACLSCTLRCNLGKR